VLCVGLSATGAFGRGGGSHHSSVTGGGAAGTSLTAPGTTALSSSGHGSVQNGPDPVLDPDEGKVTNAIKSICRGC